MLLLLILALVSISFVAAFECDIANLQKYQWYFGSIYYLEYFPGLKHILSGGQMRNDYVHFDLLQHFNIKANGSKSNAKRIDFEPFRFNYDGKRNGELIEVNTSLSKLDVQFQMKKTKILQAIHATGKESVEVKLALPYLTLDADVNAALKVPTMEVMGMQMCVVQTEFWLACQGVSVFEHINAKITVQKPVLTIKLNAQVLRCSKKWHKWIQCKLQTFFHIVRNMFAASTIGIHHLALESARIDFGNVSATINDSRMTHHIQVPEATSLKADIKPKNVDPLLVMFQPMVEMMQGQFFNFITDMIQQKLNQVQSTDYDAITNELEKQFTTHGNSMMSELNRQRPPSQCSNYY